MNDEKSRWDKLLARFPGRAVAYALILISVLAVLFKVGRDDIARDDYSLNLYTELLGVIVSVVITVFVIDELNRRRDDRRRKEELKERLLREAKSPEPTIARNAFHEMTERELIYGEESILRGANLKGASPVDVDLTGATMDGVNLEMTNFSNCSFKYANLEGAKLRSADLTHSHFDTANLENADMEGARLAHANLVDAYLSGANLLNAKANGAYLFLVPSESEGEAEPSLTEYEQMTLPDGSLASKNTEMSRFTDEKQPDFWRSEDPASPAYRGHYERRLAMRRMIDKYSWKSGIAAKPTASA